MAMTAPDHVRALGAGAPGRRREPRQPSARSLLLTVLGEYVLPGGEPVWTATLVRVLALLGVAEKAARQALARSAAEGWITSRRHGRLAQWALTDAGRRLLTEGARRIYTFGQEGPDWDGRWLVVLTGAPDGVWVSPDPGREQEASRILAELGLAGQAMSFIASYGAIGAPADVVALAWDLRAVEARYEQFIDAFTPIEPADDAAVLTAQTLLVHEWRRFPFLDPRLPRDLLPPGWPGAEAAKLFADRRARWRDGASRCWAQL